jgi:hypothetical protein
MKWLGQCFSFPLPSRKRQFINKGLSLELVTQLRGKVESEAGSLHICFECRGVMSGSSCLLGWTGRSNQSPRASVPLVELLTPEDSLLFPLRPTKCNTIIYKV